ncbi:MAG: YqaJ viral recombinase family protein [Myxococcales bacterium FL481]|nr:MAG: YqaJ viral recombinase family protein [Myxococcales bacterium FL481]
MRGLPRRAGGLHQLPTIRTARPVRRGAASPRLAAVRRCSFGCYGEAGPVKINHCEQGSHEWWDARVGIPSASNFFRIIQPVKGELSKQADTYIDELIADRLSGTPSDVGAMTSRAMEDGINREPEARQWYRESHTDMMMEEVREVGFVTTDDGASGCSPDGLIHRLTGDEWIPVRGLELKCPLLKTHIGYLRDGGLPSAYRIQVHGAMAITGLPWDFASWVPDVYGVPPLLIRLEPDEFTEKVRDALAQFAERYSQAWTQFESMRLEPVADESHPF